MMIKVALTGLSRFASAVWRAGNAVRGAEKQKKTQRGRHVERGRRRRARWAASKRHKATGTRAPGRACNVLVGHAESANRLGRRVRRTSSLALWLRGLGLCAARQERWRLAGSGATLRHMYIRTDGVAWRGGGGDVLVRATSLGVEVNNRNVSNRRSSVTAEQTLRRISVAGRVIRWSGIVKGTASPEHWINILDF